MLSVLLLLSRQHLFFALKCIDYPDDVLFLGAPGADFTLLQYRIYPQDDDKAGPAQTLHVRFHAIRNSPN